ncbi:hypothetical protein [Streptococcus pneumoniae]|uniref:hypothetical protein n=1 Tax=Streptococcus pneumoniae TaxID=1313 RepID=UPI0015DBAD82|nr:hypothetical protein [Streptococcus pneumoniae]
MFFLINAIQKEPVAKLFILNENQRANLGKLATGCSKHRFEVVDKTDEVSSKHGFVYLDTSDAVSKSIRQGDADVV